jgi:hypothetical protein
MNAAATTLQINEIDTLLGDLAVLRNLDDVELLCVGGGDVVQMGG